MSSPVPTLRSRFGKCVRNSCESQNCKLNLDAFPNEKVILDVDCIAKEKRFSIKGNRCDSIIVVEEGSILFLLPVEFKTKWVIPDKVKNQLEGGIRFFKNHHQNQFNCYPVLVSKTLNRQVSKKLQQVKVKYNGKQVRIKHVLCGRSLLWSKVKNQTSI